VNAHEHQTTTCQICGRAPAQQVVVRRHVGMILMMRMFSVKPILCREHATKLILQWTGRTLVQGWWGFLSLVIVNPATILLNLFNLVKARRMPAPLLSSAATSELTGWEPASS